MKEITIERRVVAPEIPAARQDQLLRELAAYVEAQVVARFAVSEDYLGRSFATPPTAQAIRCHRLRAGIA